jgi:hypothetical protein
VNGIQNVLTSDCQLVTQGGKQYTAQSFNRGPTTATNGINYKHFNTKKLSPLIESYQWLEGHILFHSPEPDWYHHSLSLPTHKEIMVCSLPKTCELKAKYQLCTKAPFIMMIDLIMIAAGFIICWLIFPLTRSISDNFHTSPIMYLILRLMFSVGIPYVVVKFIM